MAQTIDLIKNTSFETKMDNLISAVGGGTSSYTYLADKPSINGNTLEGNKTNSQLGISSASYKTISVGATDVNATTVDDDLSIIAGNNMTITPDSVNKTITFASVGGSGTGDMLKSTYDTDNDGIVDMAETLNGMTASIEELNYMDGVTGNVQTQFSGKEPTITKNTAFNKNFETTVTNIKANGTQSVGTSDNVPRADHVHPEQTSVSGNAATATNLQTWRTLNPSTTLNRWCKIASVKLDPAKTYADARIVILIEEIEVAAGSMCLDIACACDATAITGGSCKVIPLFGSLSLWSTYQNTFYVEYAVDTDSYLFNIWCQPRATYHTFTFSVLHESYNYTPTATTKFIRYNNPAYTTDALTGTIVNASTPYFAGNAATVTAMSSTVRGGAKVSGTDGLTMDGEVLKAAVKGLITSENDFNAQTVSTSKAVDSFILKEILDDINGGGGGIAPSNVANIVAKAGDGLVGLKWQDPNDTYVDGNLLCTWQGTKVVYKTGSYPTNETDGTLVIDSTTRNAYENDELSITGLTNDTPYYFAFFPYSDQGAVNKNIANRITATPQAYVLYGYKRTKADSNPATRLVATDMAVGMGKATMNTSTGAIDLASWTNAWFVEGNKPVMMKYDGTIDYELNPNDYTKKADGTASDIANTSYDGNAMALFPTCWVKRWEDSTYEYFQVCDIQLDSDFKAYAHQREDGSIMEWFARSIYDGANVSSKIRSISGLAPCNTVAGNTQLSYAQANGSLWDSDTWSRVALIWDLLRLMSLNDNVQNAYGYGYYTGMSKASHLKNSGTGNTKGQFYGKLENDVVKVFHVENLWGNIWKLMQGLLYNTSGKYGVKMCRPYSTTGSGYTATTFGLSGTSGGYQSAHNMSEYGLLPVTVSGSDSTYIPDGAWWNTTQQNVTRFGCSGGFGLLVGCTLALHIVLSYSGWDCGLALTCEQPLAA